MIWPSQSIINPSTRPHYVKVVWKLLRTPNSERKVTHDRYNHDNSTMLPCVFYLLNMALSSQWQHVTASLKKHTVSISLSSLYFIHQTIVVTYYQHVARTWKMKQSRLHFPCHSWVIFRSTYWFITIRPFKETIKLCQTMPLVQLITL